MARSRWGSWRQPDSAIPFPVRGTLARLGGAEPWEQRQHDEDLAARTQLEVEHARLLAQVRVEGTVWRAEILQAKQATHGRPPVRTITHDRPVSA